MQLCWEEGLLGRYLCPEDSAFLRGVKLLHKELVGVGFLLLMLPPVSIVREHSKKAHCRYYYLDPGLHTSRTERE
jgi:hypothetical protein